MYCAAAELSVAVDGMLVSIGSGSVACGSCCGGDGDGTIISSGLDGSKTSPSAHTD